MAQHGVLVLLRERFPQVDSRLTPAQLREAFTYFTDPRQPYQGFVHSDTEVTLRWLSSTIGFIQQQRTLVHPSRVDALRDIDPRTARDTLVLYHIYISSSRDYHEDLLQEMLQRLSVSENTFVTRSNVKNAGQGVFARKTLKKNTPITDFQGEPVAPEEIKHEQYALQVNTQIALDPEPTSHSTHHGSMCNSGVRDSHFKPGFEQPLYNNSRFSNRLKADDRVAVLANTTIPAGREVLVSYGKSYRWKNDR